MEAARSVVTQQSVDVMQSSAAQVDAMNVYTEPPCDVLCNLDSTIEPYCVIIGIVCWISISEMLQCSEFPTALAPAPTYYG